MENVRPPLLPKPGQLVNAVLSVTGMVLSRMFSRPVPLGYPVMLMVEPGTACQLKCPHCPTGRGELSRAAGRLTLENFKIIWDSIQPAPIRLQLWNQGEPFTNPETNAITQHAAKSGAYVALSTNVEMLAKEKLAKEVVRSGLYELILSLDGTNKKSHLSYRLDGDFEKVKAGINNVVKAKRATGSKYPILTWQFIMFKHNLHEMDEAKRLAKEWGVDRVVFKTAQLEELSREEGEKWLPDNPRQRRYKLVDNMWQLKRRARFFCDRILASAVVLWDGTVVPCCFDKTGEFPLGNALQKPFPEIWKGRKFQDYRQNWINGNRPAICDNCTEGMSGMYFRE